MILYKRSSAQAVCCSHIHSSRCNNNVKLYSDPGRRNETSQQRRWQRRWRRWWWQRRPKLHTINQHLFFNICFQNIFFFNKLTFFNIPLFTSRRAWNNNSSPNDRRTKRCTTASHTTLNTGRTLDTGAIYHTQLAKDEFLFDLIGEVLVQQ